MENGSELFILFLAPIVGLIFDFALDRKKALYLLCISLLLLLPVVTGYTYTIPYTYRVSGLIFLSCLYYFFSRRIEHNTFKIVSAIVVAGLAFFALGFLAFVDGMAGYQEVEDSWKIKNYKIEYIKDQGFAGGALMKYEISKYGWLPIFIKHVDTAIDNDTTNSCLVHFTDIKMDFNKCKISLIESK